MTCYSSAADASQRERTWHTYKSWIVDPVGTIEKSKHWVDRIAWLSNGSANCIRQVLCQNQLLDTGDRSTGYSFGSGSCKSILEVLLIDGLGNSR